jgi:hypothetical protein
MDTVFGHLGLTEWVGGRLFPSANLVCTGILVQHRNRQSWFSKFGPRNQ